jgi:SAM-dependent methyltransferase
MNLPPYTTIENGYILGTWFCGRPTERYYGAFPKSFWPRAKQILQTNGNMLHWFSGTIGKEEGMTTVDGNKNVEADYHIEGISLPFPDNHFSSAFADPPYSVNDAKRYGFKYPPARSVLRELARVTKPGGRIGLLHEFLPVVKGSGCKLIGCVGILNGPQKRIRALYLFEKL